MKISQLLVNQVLSESSDLFSDVDVIKLDPDRVDTYDIVNALVPTLVRVAYVNLVHSKEKYERTHKDEEDTPFEFTKEALEDELDSLITLIREKLDDISMHDRNSYIEKMKGEFKEKLTESSK